MFIKALLAFLVLPGIFAGLLPLYLGRTDPNRGTGSDFGYIPIIIGLVLLIWCARDFYISGKGTLAPWHPPKHLVSTGLYQYTRNPMYLAVLTIILGQALLTESTWLFYYLAGIASAFHLRVFFHEEPWLMAQFEQNWQRYRSNVPRWIPRIKPYINESAASILEKK